MFAAIVVRIERRYIKRQAHSGGLDEISVGINISRFARNTTDCLEMVRKLDGQVMKITYDIIDE